MKAMKVLNVLLALVVMLALAGCDGGSSGYVAPSDLCNSETSQESLDGEWLRPCGPTEPGEWQMGTITFDGLTVTWVATFYSDSGCSVVTDTEYIEFTFLVVGDKEVFWFDDIVPDGLCDSVTANMVLMTVQSSDIPDLPPGTEEKTLFFMDDTVTPWMLYGAYEHDAPDPDGYPPRLDATNGMEAQ
jgi:hypothetical protein